MNVPRVGLIGPRRLRQGLGPFVARELTAAGAVVPAFLCSKPDSVEPADAELRSHGVGARGFHAVEPFLAESRLDAVAILSPPETHARFLDAAAGAGLHALCEKPLVWGGPSPTAAARACVASFERRGLLLVENCQWPDTLADFSALHPGVLDEAPERFSMRLSPSGNGESMLVDSLSHPLSLLQAWVPIGESTQEDWVEKATFQLYTEDNEPAIAANFDFLRGDARVVCRVDLVRQREQPRRAGYALNGRRAERLVEMADYSMFFRDGERRVAMADPLATRMKLFVSWLRRQMGGLPPVSEPHMSQRVTTPLELVARVQMLEDLVGAFREAVDATGKRKST